MKKEYSIFREFEHIEQEFFDIDEDKGEARVCLHFERPSDIFDVKYLSKTPLLNEEFISSIEYVFKRIPDKYRIALEVFFDDLEQYTPEQLSDIFEKDLVFSARTMTEAHRNRDLTALWLSVTGLVSFFAMMLVRHYWTADTFWHNVLLYLLDIATTVLFWEAVNMFLLENWAQDETFLNFEERFSSISFQRKPQ